MSPKYNFTGKVALITGSSHPNGIGAAIAVQFVRCGTQVVITGRNGNNLREVGKKVHENSDHEPLEVVGDLLDYLFAPQLMRKTIEKYGRLDFMVCNAGGGNENDHGFENPKLLDAYDKIMDVNVRSVLQLTQLAVPYLEKNRDCVINISSISGDKNEPPQFMCYCTSKAALDMLTKCSAGQLAPKGIRVNAISFGPVWTAGGRMVSDEHYFANNRELLESKIPMGRIADPEKIASLSMFLASDDAINMTGSVVVTDGGLLVKA